MLLFSIPVLFVLVTVSEAAQLDDRGLAIDQSNENIRRVLRQKHIGGDDLANGAYQKPEPCPERRALNEETRRSLYQDAPKQKYLGGHWEPVMPVPVTNEEVYIPSERLLPKHQSQDDQKLPEEIPQKVTTQVPDYAHSKSPFRVKVIKPTEQVSQNGPIETDRRTGAAPKIKPNPIQNYDSGNSASLNSNSEETSRQIVLPYDDHRHAIYQVPKQNKTVKPHKFFDLVNPNSQIETFTVHDSDLIAPSKPKTKPQFAESDKCQPKSDEPSEEFPLHSRRAMPQDENVKHINENNLQIIGQLQQNPQKQVAETDGDTNRFAPGFQYPTPSRAPLRSVTLLMEPTYQDPTKGVGIAPLSDIRGHMMQGSKVCYACSTLNDASCWLPDRTTTVKYCRPGHDVCVTKSYRSTAAASVIVIRDCASSCEVDTPGLNTHYDSCAVCREDMCNNLYIENSAFRFNAINSIFILFCTLFVKYVL